MVDIPDGNIIGSMEAKSTEHIWKDPRAELPCHAELATKMRQKRAKKVGVFP